MRFRRSFLRASVVAAVGLVAALFGAVAGCGRTTCPSRCAADPELSIAERDRCEGAVMPVDAPSCRAAYVEYLECAASRTVCTRDDFTDEAATVQAVLKDCGPQLKTYTDCTSR